MILGQKLKVFRKTRNYTQEQFAQILGVKRSGYASYEAGRVGVSTSMLQDLSKHFKMSIDDLLKEINGFKVDVKPQSSLISEPDVKYTLTMTEQFIAELREDKRMLLRQVDILHREVEKLIDKIPNREADDKKNTDTATSM